MITTPREVLTAAVETGNRFPPSFYESPLTYWFALTSLSIIVVMSAAIIVQNVINKRARRETVRDLTERGFFIVEPKGGTKPELLCDYMCKAVNGFAITMFLGTIGDTLVMLLWNEVSALNTLRIYQFDRITDGCSIIPFLYSAIVLTMTEEPLMDRLTRNARAGNFFSMLKEHFHEVANRGRLILLTMTLCAGVAFYKSMV